MTRRRVDGGERDVGAAPGALRRSPWLAAQPAAFAERLLAIGRLRPIERGRLLFRQDEASDDLYGLAWGMIELTGSVDGEGAPFLRCGPGAWLGDDAVLGDATRLTTARAVQDGLVLAAPGATVRAMLDDRPDWWPCLLDLRRRTLALTMRLTADLTTLTPAERLARHILDIADSEGVAWVIQSELGALMGASGTTARRALAALRAAGAVEGGYGKVAIRDRAALERMARRGP